MRPEQIADIERIFLEVRALAEPARTIRLAEACHGNETLMLELASLLAHDTREHEPTELQDGAGPINSMDAGWRPGTRVGAYTINVRLGVGATSNVYRATHAHTGKPAAIKLLRRGLAGLMTRQRFRDEGRILGLLHHPGIAHIFDTGEFEFHGTVLSYLVMEYIDGDRITEYVTAERLKALEVAELLASACDALHCAHQRGIIHRDLKPSNILIDRQGRAKIIDFGIARSALSDTAVTATLSGQILGTLAYMSPEQALLSSKQLDIRTDIFALGAVAYELMSGRPPHETNGKSILEIIHAIESDVPAPLGTINRECRGDFEMIVAKCLEHDRECRYSSAAALGEDLRRLVRSEPIQARPPTLSYRFRTYIRRNKALSIAMLLIAVVMIAGLAGTVFGLFRAEIQRRNADRRNQDLVMLADGLLGDLVESIPWKRFDREEDAVHILEEFTQRFEVLSINLLSLTEAQLRRRIGAAFLDLRHNDVASAHLEQALALYQSVESADSIEMLRTQNLLAQSYRLQGRPEHAKRHWSAIIDTARFDSKEHTRIVSAAMINLGAMLRDSQQYHRARELYQRAAELSRNDPARLALIEDHLGMVYAGAEQYSDAVALLEKSLAFKRQSERYGRDHTSTANTMQNLGQALSGLDRHEEARRFAEQATSIFALKHGQTHARTLSAKSMLARIYLRGSWLEDADALATEVHETALEELGPTDIRTIAGALTLAQLRFKEGELDQAEAMCKNIAYMSEQWPAPARTHTALSIMMADIQSVRGRNDQAINVLTAEINRRSEQGLSSTLDAATILQRRAECALKLTQYERAKADLSQALAIFRDVLEEDDARIIELLDLLAEVNQPDGA